MVAAVSVKGLESAYATVTIDTDVTRDNDRGTGLEN
jgi:hypothetical protein